MFRYSLFACLCLSISGCAAQQADPDPVSFLALGDSYTIGESVAESERWPDQLAGLLRERSIDISPPRIVARTGWTTDELADAVASAGLTGPYDLVSLLIGVNNQYRGRDVGQYRMQFRGLLDQAISFAGGDPSRVVVLSIPDWGVTPFAEGRDRAEIAAAIHRFNSVNEEETLRAGAHYIDVTAVSRRAASDPSLLAPDGLHPSGVMYAKWADLALPIVLDVLR